MHPDTGCTASVRVIKQYNCDLDSADTLEIIPSTEKKEH